MAHTKLDGSLAYDIISMLMLHADILIKTSDNYPDGCMLQLLGRDIQRKIEQVFAQINEQHPEITVEPPSSDENVSIFFIEDIII